MRLSAQAAALTACLLLSACAAEKGNSSSNAVNVAAEEGIVDVNSGISGDELAINRQAADDMAPPAEPSNSTLNTAR